MFTKRSAFTSFHKNVGHDSTTFRLLAVSFAPKCSTNLLLKQRFFGCLDAAENAAEACDRMPKENTKRLA
jgi:hypothetical protein